MWPISTLPILALLSLALLGTAAAQFNLNLNSQMINNLVGNLLDGLNTQAGPQRPVCVPYNPGADYKTLQDWCKSLSLADDQFWDEKYRTAAGPDTLGNAFPMQGCVLGCMYVSFLPLFFLLSFDFLYFPPQFLLLHFSSIFLKGWQRFLQQRQ
jgi:hypothetical protein